jgi:hypothetical protein
MGFVSWPTRFVGNNIKIACVCILLSISRTFELKRGPAQALATKWGKLIKSKKRVFN